MRHKPGRSTRVEARDDSGRVSVPRARSLRPSLGPCLASVSFSNCAKKGSQAGSQNRFPKPGIPLPARKKRPTNIYETEGHRFESCRARSSKAGDSAQRCELPQHRRYLPDSVEIAPPAFKPDRTIAQTSPRAFRHTRLSTDRLGAFRYPKGRRFESGPRHVPRNHPQDLSRCLDAAGRTAPAISAGPLSRASREKGDHWPAPKVEAD